ncbi:hypothetical protein [Spirillospora sp. NPDC047279]|uniref:hypothetical protein n=1 Tax=Spirillospora sp. NPDC047279 TaxID=3155478 RepID=UPI0033C8A1B0
MDTRRDEAAQPDAGPSRDATGVRWPSGRALSIVLWVTLGWMAGLERLDDNSFLTHLRTGHWILDHGVPHQDIYSFTVPGRSWVAQSWLMEVVYAALDRLTGPVGITLLNCLIGAVIAYLAFRLAERARGGGRVFLALGPAMLLSVQIWVERPLLPALLAFVVLIWIVEVPDSLVGRHPLVAVPVLMWSWVNVHGTFALGFGYLAFHLAGRWLDGAPPWRDRELTLLRSGLLGFGACVLNPYGVELVLFPFQLLGKGEALHYVHEWKSPDFRTFLGISILIWLAAFILLLARAKPSRRDLTVALPFVLLSFWALRNAAIAPLVCLPVAARMLGAPAAKEPVRRRANLVLIVAVVLGVTALTRQAAAAPAFSYDRYPVEAMRRVDQQGMIGHRMLTTHVWSAYVIHAYWPRQKVFMDDRFDMYPEQFTVEYMKARDGEGLWRPLLERYQVDVVVWETGTSLTEILSADPDWRQIYRDDDATVLIRR